MAFFVRGTSSLWLGGRKISERTSNLCSKRILGAGPGIGILGVEVAAHPFRRALEDSKDGGIDLVGHDKVHADWRPRLQSCSLPRGAKRICHKPVEDEDRDAPRHTPVSQPFPPGYLFACVAEKLDHARRGARPRSLRMVSQAARLRQAYRLPSG